MLDTAFSAEARIVGFTKSAKGVFIRLELSPPASPEFAEADPTQRYMVAFAPMPDDQRDPTPRALDEGERAIALAGILCKSTDFQEWFECLDEETAVIKLRACLKVKTRAELRTNPAAVKRLYALEQSYRQANADAFDL